MMNKTLLILPNAIGDVVCGIGIANEFLKCGSVAWIVNPSASGILQNMGFEIIHPPSKLIQRMNDFGAPVEVLRHYTKMFLDELKKTEWNNVINLHLTRASSLIAGSIRAKKFFGPAVGEKIISDSWSDFILSSTILGLLPDIDVICRYSLIAGFNEKIEPDLTHLRNTSNENIIVFHPGSGWSSKRCGIDQAAEIADRLSQFGKVAVIGAPHEIEYLDAIKKQMKSRYINFIPGCIEDAVSLILSSVLVVTTDTWAMHLSSAAGIKTLALLGPTRIFPNHSGYAISVKGDPSWKDKDDDSVKQIISDDIVKLTECLLHNDEPKEKQFSDNAVVWDCREDYQRALWNPDYSANYLIKKVFVWARAKAFDEIIGETYPKMPRLKLQPIKESYPYIFSKKLKIDMFENLFIENNFPLFETTFIGRNTALIQNKWIRLTKENLEKC